MLSRSLSFHPLPWESKKRGGVRLGEDGAPKEGNASQGILAGKPRTGPGHTHRLGAPSWACVTSLPPRKQQQLYTGTMGIVEKIKEIEAEMARTQKNKATEYHLGQLKAKLAKLRTELQVSHDARPRRNTI